MSDAAHLFLVQADLARLACDDALVPTGADRTITEAFVPLLPPERVGPATGGGARRVEPGPEQPSRDPFGRRAWLVDTASAAPDVDRIGSAVEGWLADVAALDSAPAYGRGRRVAALPLVGTGGGGAGGRRGDLLRALLPRLHDAARAHDIDVALVLASASDHAAAQRVRLDLDLPWPLPEPLARAARSLAGHAAAGELAIFVGAGVSAAAGLPLWDDLIDRLTATAGIAGDDLGALHRLSPQDAASLLERRLGGERLRREVAEIFADRPHALAHALLAALPVDELVTTNFDALLESAAAGAGRPVRVVPHERPGGDERWLLKVHGDVAAPASVVLTREEFLEYDAGRAALAGVVESLLLTRHTLFVGLSLGDDNVVRMAHRVDKVRADGGPIGTVLSLRHDPLRAELWSGVVDEVAMTPRGSESAVAARRLEVFLDLVGALAARPVGYLLDEAYAGMLTDPERALADRLRAVAAVAAEAGETPAWQPVAALLQHLGSDGAGPPGRPSGR